MGRARNSELGVRSGEGGSQISTVKFQIEERILRIADERGKENEDTARKGGATG